MKKLLRILFRRNVELAKLQEANAKLNKWRAAAQEEITRLLKAVSTEKLRTEQLVNILALGEHAARAQLMQLRVYGLSDSQRRTGYGVTAFIPTEVLDTLRVSPVGVLDNFCLTIAAELVRRALRGLWNINSRGAVSALVFEPVMSGSHTPGVMGIIFDTPAGPEITLRTKGITDARKGISAPKF